MAIIWDQNSISILVLPDKDLHKELYPIFQEWVSQGLLGRFLLIGSDDISLDEFGTVNLSCLIWGDGENGEDFYKVNLFDQIAQHEFKVVRLIALQSLDSTFGRNKNFSNELGQVASAVNAALPMANARLNETQQVTRFLKINLIVSPSNISAQDYSAAFVKNWDMHVIASPEDRSTPWTPDARVQVGERYLRFILTHLATTAGIWNGIGTSPFELVDRESSKDGAKWLSRVFVNTILTDGLSRRVAARTLEEIAISNKDIFDSNVAVQVRGTRPIPPEEVVQWIDWMIDQTFALEDSFLSFNAPIFKSAPGKLRWLELEQIKNYLLFCWDKLRVIPWWMYVWVRRLVGRKLTQAFQTDEGLAEIGINQDDPMDMRDQRLAYKLAEIKEYAESAKLAISATEAQRSWKGTPRLWAGIRKLLFGMLDGSDLTEFGISEAEGLVPVFSNTGQVITDPSDGFKIPAIFQNETGIEEINWSNIDQVDSLVNASEEKIKVLRTKQTSISTEIDKLKREIDSLDANSRGY